MGIAVLGAGSLGLLFAARLSRFNDVKLITRSEEQADLIRSQGIRIEGEAAPYSPTEAVSITQAVNDALIGDKPELLLLMVKQSALDEAFLLQISKLIAPASKVICFQNGVGHTEQLFKVLNADQIVVAVTTEGARNMKDNVVDHTGSGVTAMDLNQKKCAAMLEKAGFEISLSNNMEARIWSKLIVNSVINPISAVLNKRNGELLESSCTLSLMKALFEEGIAVAQALHVNIQEDLWTTLLHVCERTAHNHSSMLQDLMHGRKTEIESINGSLLRVAKEHGLTLPVNQVFYQLVKAMENK